MAIDEKFLSGYEPKKYEDQIYKTWEDSGYFNPDKCVEDEVCLPDAETFSIVLPPPNATGVLHLGHALESSMQDIAVRFNRMNGKRTLWIPGTDHAAIATDTKVTKLLEKQGIKKKEIGREEFLKHVEDFVEGSRSTIQKQLRKVGDSLDWSREAFTLDETRQKAVYITFKRMHDDGLIYQKNRIVNWDPKGQTTISDDEVVHEERKAKMYTFKYSKDCPIEIATTRPETKLGDTAIAVHPDGKWKEYIGQEFSFEFAGEPVTVKVVGDEYVDPEFGTGALGVTPAHSQADWEIGERHNLEVKQVINEYGKMMVGMEEVLGKKTSIAREAVAEWLEAEGLLINTEEIDQNISTAERTGAIIEPLPKIQWWIDVNKKFRDGKSLKDMMLEAVRGGDIGIMPERFEKVYFNWIENLRDWNISRQIWYGHRIPVWYKDGEIEVSRTSPGEGWTQDEDTLDTWFSSALWTFSTLGWPEETPDFKAFHPTTLMNPGYEILFFWVARMVLMSKYLLDDNPFKTVYLHGMLRDEKGRKFSKSLGNGIDPIEVIEEYGADALRMAMTIGITPGMDSKFDIQKLKAYKKFSNKVWNVSRFVLTETEGFNVTQKQELTAEHAKYISDFEELTKEITKEMDEYKFYLVGEKLYHYVWHTFADEIIEKTKEDMTDSAKYTLYYLFTNSLKLLHPFMPFITEEIWKSISQKDSKLLMVEKWPS
jgi:valyl-tRNA synthetase